VGSQLEPFRVQPLRAAALLLGNWRWVTGIPVVAGLLATCIVLLVPPRFESRVLLLPESSATTGLPSNLASVAGQFGLTIPTEPGRSPDFYGDLVRSRVIVEEVLQGRYGVTGRSVSSSPDSADLLTVLQVRGSTERKRIDAGAEWLRKATTVEVRKTGIIDLRVRAVRPELAAAIANEYVIAVNRFNAERRQSQARQRREFVQGRAAAVDSELRGAEDNLREFYERNRQWQSAPKLVFEEGRLRRQLDVRQELVLSLRRELEAARIAEVNDAPVVTVIESGVPATSHITPRRTYIVVGTTGLVFLVVVIGLLGREYRSQLAASDATYGELHATWRQFLKESRLGAVLPSRQK